MKKKQRRFTTEGVSRAYSVPPWIIGEGSKPSWFRRPFYRFGWWLRVRRVNKS